MTRDRFGGGPRRPARRRGLWGPWLGIIGVAALCVLLALVTAGQLAASARQAGRPGFDAQVVACPPSGGDGARCTVRVTRDGHDLFLPLSDGTLVLPEPGDHLTVALADDGSAVPAGWRPWVATGVLLALLGIATRGALYWWRRLRRAGTAGAEDPWADAAHRRSHAAPPSRRGAA